VSRPVIALAPCSTPLDYEVSIRRAGGEPRLLDRVSDVPADVIHQVDGVLLAGGGDVRPRLYGEPPHAAFSPAEPGRDEYELELARRALDADLPVLAICRGVQVLNVARGGTLVQHIPDEIGLDVAHAVREPANAVAHEVTVTPGSLLDRLLQQQVSGAAACPVNSRHHQAPRAPGEGLIVTATAPDGVIEALEDPTKRFCLGVQWHPENFWRTGEFRGLFEGFVRACTK
jgi:putative glutamine amidotransferase